MNTQKTITFGKRHSVAVTFYKGSDGLWHAHGGLLVVPRKSLKAARAAVASRLQSLSRLGPGSKVKLWGSTWRVVEWQPENGKGGAYWLRNSKGEDAVAGPDKVERVS